MDGWTTSKWHPFGGMAQGTKFQHKCMFMLLPMTLDQSLSRHPDIPLCSVDLHHLDVIPPYRRAELLWQAVNQTCRFQQWKLADPGWRERQLMNYLIVKEQSCQWIHSKVLTWQKYFENEFSWCHIYWWSSFAKRAVGWWGKGQLKWNLFCCVYRIRSEFPNSPVQGTTNGNQTKTLLLVGNSKRNWNQTPHLC